MERLKKISFVQGLTSKIPSNLFFSININGNVGYNNQANALANKLIKAESQNKEVIQITLENMLEIEVKTNELLDFLREKGLKKITLVSSGGFGLEFFNTFAEKIGKIDLPMAVEYQYTTDRFFDISNKLYDGQWIQNLYITSIDGIDEFNHVFASCVNKPKILKTDLVQVNPEGIKKQSEDFRKNNIVVCEEIERFEGLNSGIAFIGGRVQNPDSSWMENNPEVFTNTAKYLMEQKVRVFATHGLRSFTKSDKTNDFSSMEAFYQIVREKLGVGESAYIFTQQEISETTRTPILKKITKQESSEIIEEETIINGNSYSYLLYLSANKNLSIYPTIEQTTLPSEAVFVGVNPNNIIPLSKEERWNIYIDSNIRAYEYFLKSVRPEKPIIPFDAVIKSKEQALSTHLR